MTLRPPGGLPRSAYIDIDRLMRGQKEVVRLIVGDDAAGIRRWARRSGFFTSADADGYVVLSRCASSARRALDLDRRPGRHTAALGRMLGYPPCCSRKAARVGDEGIDAMQAALAARRFIGLFALIDPRGYREGSALLSHVPCSHVCTASLAMVLRSRSC